MCFKMKKKNKKMKTISNIKQATVSDINVVNLYE